MSYDLTNMHILRFLALGLTLSAPAIRAQVYTAGTIEFLNCGEYSHDDLEGAAGIHPGGKFTADDLSASAQRLVDTGYFDDVTASLVGKFTSMKVTYQLKPTPKAAMLHVGYQNFVWLSRAEIDAAVKVKSPLFRGYLPEGSANQDLLKTALTEALASKGLQSAVVYETVEPTLAHPVREIEFRVSKPFVRVANVKLGGVSTALVPYVQKSVNGTALTAFVEEPSGLTTADKILEPLLDAGYVQASLSEMQVTPDAAADGRVGVVVAATLNSGEVYKAAGVTFAGAPLFSADEFASKAKLHAGDVASRKALLETLQPLDSTYRRQGYMDVTIVARPAIHEETHEVAYTVTLAPGEQYRVDELTAENLDAGAKAAFEKVFRTRKGELYNPEYVAEFIKNNSSVKEFQPYVANYVAYAHPKTHTVDLVITFAHR